LGQTAFKNERHADINFLQEETGYQDLIVLNKVTMKKNSVEIPGFLPASMQELLSSHDSAHYLNMHGTKVLPPDSESMKFPRLLD
jgi:hypothetical protein